MNGPLSAMQPKDVQLDDLLLKNTFLEHLNYIYIGKQHLLKFFEEARQIATLKTLKQAIQEAIGDTLSQVEHLNEMYVSIETKPSATKTIALKALTLEGYLAAIKAGKTPLEKDVFILFYLQQIEGMEITYYKVLKNLAKAVGYTSTFLNQPFDLAVENKILFETIYEEYIS